MSSMLEQAIIDATALKEAAIKNAEAAIIEKYAPEVKRAVSTLLEQDEDLGLDPDMALGGDMGAPAAMETGVELANINSNDQMVISGEKIAVAQAMDLCVARGAKKAIRLPVSGAFHSSLMKHAAPGLEQAITSMDFKDPQMPIIGNYTGTPLNTAEEVKQELIDGLCNCVQWKKSICF